MDHRKASFLDEIVVYHSDEDGCWIAHSLRTDQIGTGDCVVHALADGLRAVQQVRDLAETDNAIAVMREAPAEVQALAQTAARLPGEIYEIAHKMVSGEWPADLKTDVTPEDAGKSFTFKEEAKAVSA